MVLNILSQDYYFSHAIRKLFHSLGSYNKYESVFFIDVMNLPALSLDDKNCVCQADCLIFIVDRMTDYLLIHHAIFHTINETVAVKCISRSSTLHELEEVIRGEVKFNKVERNVKKTFNTSEWKLINSIKSGIPISLNPIYKDTNQQTLSAWKRSIMRKLDITGDINLYLIVMKCCSLADWFNLG